MLQHHSNSLNATQYYDNPNTDFFSNDKSLALNKPVDSSFDPVKKSSFEFELVIDQTISPFTLLPY
jgi:hypothetical protein